MESPQTTISCGRFFQHPYSESVGFRRVSAHVPSYGSIGDQQSVPKPNLTGKLLILNRMKAMAIAGPFQNLSNHFKTNDVLSGAKRTVPDHPPLAARPAPESAASAREG